MLLFYVKALVSEPISTDDMMDKERIIPLTTTGFLL